MSMLYKIRLILQDVLVLLAVALCTYIHNYRTKAVGVIHVLYSVLFSHNAFVWPHFI